MSEPDAQNRVTLACSYLAIKKDYAFPIWERRSLFLIQHIIIQVALSIYDFISRLSFHSDNKLVQYKTSVTPNQHRFRGIEIRDTILPSLLLRLTTRNGSTAEISMQMLTGW